MKWLNTHLAVLSTAIVILIGWLVTHQAPTVIVADKGKEQAGLLTAAAATTNHLPPFWRERLLAVLGAPQKPENLRLLTAWGKAEGGTAQWNPLNATYTLSYGESWAYNGSLVQNYWRPTGGIAATALTLVQANYSCILSALQAGKLTADETVNKCSAQFKTWGTNPNVILGVLNS